MKRIDASPSGIFEINWSNDGKWVTYVAGEDEVRLASVETGEIRIVGRGRSPSITHDMSVLIERDQQVVLVMAKGEKVIAAKKDLVKDTPKQSPQSSPDGKKAIFVVCNVFDKVSQTKNAYPYRHFVAIADIDSGRSILTDEQWYGGSATWFPDGKRFAHFEFDSTAGPQVHIVSERGESEGALAGLYPSVCPDGTRLAVKPRGGGSLVIYTSKGGWNDQQVESNVLRIPGSSATQTSGTPPIWLDNRFIVLDEGGQLYRVDTKRDKTDEIKKLPRPTARRKHSMIPSPNREHMAVEVKGEEHFELVVIPLT